MNSNIISKIESNGLIAFSWLGTGIGALVFGLRNLDAATLTKQIFKNGVTPVQDLAGQAGYELFVLGVLVAAIVAVADDLGVLDT